MWLWKKIKSRKKCFADTYSKVIPITPTKKEKWKKKFTTAYITGEVHGLRLCPSCHKWNVLLHSVKQMLNLSQQNERTDCITVQWEMKTPKKPHCSPGKDSTSTANALERGRKPRESPTRAFLKSNKQEWDSRTKRKLLPGLPSDPEKWRLT